MKISLFDPSLKDEKGQTSDNLGDLIIKEAVVREIKNIFIDCEIIHLHTHTAIKRLDIDLAQNCPLIFVGGTNLLGAARHQWALKPVQAIQIARAILLGVGWQSYEEKVPSLKYQIFLKLLLSNKFIHSVRDPYTQKKLQSIGIRNVLNTGCPTMWPFIKINTIEEIPRYKSNNALIMLTDYRKNHDLDKKLLELVLSKYEKVFFWPQGAGDLNYMSQFHLLANINVLDRSLDALKNFINSGISFDYIGTRLHGGIQCLLGRKRSLILEVDNRAKEVAKDTGLPTCERSDIPYVSRWIEELVPTRIKIDSSSIDTWKLQFRNIEKINLGKIEKKMQIKLAKMLSQ